MIEAHDLVKRYGSTIGRAVALTASRHGVAGELTDAATAALGQPTG
jgi:hypothetical protein